jgi:hypothetical protein
VLSQRARLGGGDSSGCGVLDLRIVAVMAPQKDRRVRKDKMPAEGTSTAIDLSQTSASLLLPRGSYQLICAVIMKWNVIQVTGVNKIVELLLVVRKGCPALLLN